MRAYRWLFDIIKVAKPQIIQSIFLNICINFIQIFTSLFVMVVYNKIIPNSAISSLITLVVGIGLVLLFDLIFKVFAKNVFLQFSCIFGPKNLPKTLPKRGPNPLKIDAKNVLFFNIDFFGFRPRFWRVLGLQVGTKFAVLGSQDVPKSLQNPVF